MSKASEWAIGKAQAPAIDFVRGDYRVRASVNVVFGPDSSQDLLFALGLIDSNGSNIGLTPDNALALARFILDTFEDKP